MLARVTVPFPPGLIRKKGLLHNTRKCILHYISAWRNSPDITKTTFDCSELVQMENFHWFRQKAQLLKPAVLAYRL